jgi:hypothetical protein
VLIHGRVDDEGPAGGGLGDGSSFSLQDVAMLGAAPGLRRVFAHGHDGTVYELRRIGPIPAATHKAVETASVAALDHAVMTGRLTVGEMRRFERHAVNAALARRGLIGYSAHWSPATGALWNQVSHVVEDAIQAGSEG